MSVAYPKARDTALMIVGRFDIVDPSRNAAFLEDQLTQAFIAGVHFQQDRNRHMPVDQLDNKPTPSPSQPPAYVTVNIYNATITMTETPAP